MEKQISFKSHGETLYGMLHLPDVNRKSPAVVMYHGFTGQRIESHRLFVKMARRLMADGIAALRFDFRGSGESEGDFRDMTISGEIDDALAAIDFLCGQPEVDTNRLGVLGLSMGGCVAASVAGRGPSLKTLVLWSAVAQVAELFQHGTGQEKIAEWRRVGEIDLGGLMLGVGFLDDLPRIDPLKNLSQFKGASLIIHGSEDAVVPVTEAHVYHKHLGDRSTLHIIDGADHTFNRSDWEQDVIDTTVRWLKRELCH
jgi:dienelactone hydrolase